MLEVYPVPLRALLALPGSGGHEDLIELIRDECWFADEVNDMMHDDPDEDGPQLSFIDVVTRIINGQPLDGAPDWAVGYAFEAICWGLGSTLCMVSNFFHHSDKDLDQFLLRSGVPVRLEDLRSAGAILDIPEPNGLPFMGWWSPDQICRARAILAQLPLDAVEPTLADDIRKIRRWLEESIEQEGDCIVGFQIAH